MMRNLDVQCKVVYYLHIFSHLRLDNIFSPVIWRMTGFICQVNSFGWHLNVNCHTLNRIIKFYTISGGWNYPICPILIHFFFFFIWNFCKKWARDDDECPLPTHTREKGKLRDDLQLKIWQKQNKTKSRNGGRRDSPTAIKWSRNNDNISFIIRKRKKMKERKKKKKFQFWNLFFFFFVCFFLNAAIVYLIASHPTIYETRIGKRVSAVSHCYFIIIFFLFFCFFIFWLGLSVPAGNKR